MSPELVEYGPDYVDLLDLNNSARVKARIAWRNRIEAAGFRLAEEVEHERKAGTARVHSKSRSLPSGPAPSRHDPMPELFVVGLALLTLFAIFGAISIGQFLQRMLGG